LINQVKETAFHQGLRVVEPYAEIISIVVGENILVKDAGRPHRDEVIGNVKPGRLTVGRIVASIDVYRQISTWFSEFMVENQVP
jgi:hypothetical protein